ncbi:MULTISPECIES: glucose-1-phosphate thymidylyltransferase [Halomicrobium]|uniref:Glucose-1-phosphate thymidyltransferase n=2 Tax=Halomicrobium mukohataei TaxID=57705 RepID=C7P2L6_HALMD|nr:MULTISPECIES: glucose-1-phosphate thymidylyltransferase [Halomicrobium]ACV47338.1 glucose-1-phosphate thymidyltransferase [Halomicrobium mukohataei DSM 12286]QCD65806.1 glucose-1-phosphate thymidylyltransferase [Halomicrobium mukohataei]QFR20611.1 glucose-1-phosphate thymidylyltransferase [Halomicrobium sp. ZPS1]
MKGVLLSGGTGSRLRPITHTGPKQLVPVANKPVLEYAVEDLRGAGITEIGVILGNKGRNEIQKLLGDGSDYGVEITYIVQGNPLGLAHAAGCARDFVGDDDFVMYLGDNILKSGVTDLVESFEAGDYGAGIALQEVDDPQAFGITDIDDQGNVTKLIEKPDEPPTDLALIGMYVFSPAIFDAITELEPSWRGELEITDAIQRLLDDGYEIDSHVVTGWWKDTGKPEDILEANRLVLKDKELNISGTIEDGAETDGQIELADSAIIEADAVVRGPVSIAENTTIKDGTYVGPYTSIGANSTLEDIHIENSVVIGDSDITADGRIVDSLLGRKANVESAAELLPEGRRLVIGENSQLKL